MLNNGSDALRLGGKPLLLVILDTARVDEAEGDVNCAHVRIDDGLGLLGIGDLCEGLERVGGVWEVQKPAHAEGHQEHDGDRASAVSEADILSDLGGVDHVELDILGSDLALQIGRHFGVDIGIVSVENKDGTLTSVFQEVVFTNIGLGVASNVVSGLWVVLGLDLIWAESQVGDCNAAGLFTIKLEVGLALAGRHLVLEDLHAVSDGADGAISTNCVNDHLLGLLVQELELSGIEAWNCLWIVDTEAESMALRLLEGLEASEDFSWGEVVASDTISNVLDLLENDVVLASNSDDFLVEEFAVGDEVSGSVKDT